MNENLNVTENINKIVQNAGVIALQYNSFKIDVHHLLYGLSVVDNTVAYSILQNFNVTKEKIENVFHKNFTKSNATVLNSQLDFTENAKEVFLFAKQFCEKVGNHLIDSEHLLIGIILCEDSFAVNMLKKSFRININDFKKNILQVIKSKTISNYSNSNSENNSNNYNTRNEYNYSSNENIYNEKTESKQIYNDPYGNTLPEEFKEMGIDLTEKARLGKIDKIIGRSEEIERVIEILCRKNKNNPVLIGEAGVGKSAIIEGLALAIAKDEVPDLLKNKIIFSLELGGLVAGTKYRGSLEEKLKKIIDYVKNNDNVIVFIDEIHTLAQVGGEKGEINPSDMLKPYLARGEFQTIGATTTNEYRQYIEKDKALERRFQPVIVNPPTVEDTIEILYGLKENFEKYHNVIISNNAIESAVKLSDRYITDRNLPDKAIDIIDEASSKAKILGMKSPSEISIINGEIQRFEELKTQAMRNEDIESAVEYRDKIRELNLRKNEIKQELESNSNTTNIIITEQDVCSIISSWSGIPISKLSETEKDKLLHLEEILHKRVIGQEEAVTAVCKAVRRARIGLKDNKKPIGSFMFLGQSGVGKTELCKALAEAMFDENAIIRLDMSEYMEKHSVSKLIGSPPGYVGFDEGGQLTEQVRRKPYSVVLFDEIEKAHPDVYNLLLQVLDEGRLTDSQGRLVNFKNTIIIFTSNVGISSVPSYLYKSNGYNEEDNYNEIKSILLENLRKNFKVEFINRIDVITVFHPLTINELAQISKIFITNLNQRLNEKGVGLKITETALKYLITQGYDTEYGARPLRRLIEQEIEDKIAEEMINGNIRSNNTVVISCRDNTLEFKVIDHNI